MSSAEATVYQPMEQESTFFKQAVNSLTFDKESSSCITTTTESVGSQSGGTNNVSIDNLTILIMLAHGLINLTPKAIKEQASHQVIEPSTLSHIQNLAIFGFAPTGIANIGNCQELSTISGVIQKKLESLIQLKIDESLQSIENKIKQLTLDENDRQRLEGIKSKRIISKQNIFSKVCNFCFKAFGRLTSLSTVVNYTFNNILSVCKNISTSSVFYSYGGGKRKFNEITDDSIITSSFSMSHDMCVLMLDDLRSSIQNFDRVRFPIICQGLEHIPVYKEALNYCHERCRKLYIVKGFGSGQLPFVNKHFQYNRKADKQLNMGVVKLKFSIDSNGNVNSNTRNYDPRYLMTKAGYIDPITGSWWSSMQEWLDQCLEPGDRTVCIVDLSCSGIVCEKQTLVELPGDVQSLGGGGVIKKKSYSRKNTRKNSKQKSIRKN